MNVSVAAFDPSRPVAIVRREGLRPSVEPFFANAAWNKYLPSDHRWTSLADAIAGAEAVQADVMRPVSVLIQHGDHDFALHRLSQHRWVDPWFAKPKPLEDSGVLTHHIEPVAGTPLTAEADHVVAGMYVDQYRRFTGPLEIARDKGVVALVGHDWTLLSDGTLTRRAPTS